MGGTHLTSKQRRREKRVERRNVYKKCVVSLSGVSTPEPAVLKCNIWFCSFKNILHIQKENKLRQFNIYLLIKCFILL